jgi:hypothetical protein
MRRPLILAAALSLVATLTGVSAAATRPTAAERGGPCSSTASPSFGIDLAGTWKFVADDDPAWSSPSYNDSAWENRVVPDDWNKTDQSGYDGYAWYRKTFTLPKRPAGITDAAIIAAMGFIDDADVTYLNGKEIGRTGAFPPSFDSAWDVPREYYPASGLLRWGARNVIAVRMYDGTGGGGFYKGPIGLFSKAKLRTLHGLHTRPATERQRAVACRTLATQHQALADRDAAAYLRTLDRDFFHSGDTVARRAG